MYKAVALAGGIREPLLTCSSENNIPTTKLPAVLQILNLSCIRFQTDSCPASVENISGRLRGILLREKYFSLEEKQSFFQQK